MTFSDVVEAVKALSTEEKQTMQALLEQYLREERRNEIHENLQSARADYQQGDLPSASDIRQLKRMLEEEEWQSVSVLHSSVCTALM
jgi:Flp pilus assembly protein TadD